MRIKLLFPIIIYLSIFSCASLTTPPNDINEINKGITFEFDKFENIGWLTSDYYVSEDNFISPVELRYQYQAAFDESNKLLTIQLYMELFSSEWYFIDRIRDSLGNSYRLRKMDKKVNSGTQESFIIILTKEDLEMFTKGDKVFKLIGKRGEVIFTLPSLLSSVFLKRQEER